MRVRVVAATVVAMALVVPAPSTAGPRDVLPNLVPLPPGDVVGPQTGLLSSFGYGYPVPPVVVDGCLPDEIARKQALRCLRFETVVANAGEGHLEVVYRPEAPVPGAYQVIYRRDGTARERFAVASEYHPTHLHWHFPGFYVVRLLRGSKPVAHGEKSGFCPEDGGRYSGGGEPRYSCLADYRTDELAFGQVVGISAGWSDSYRVHLPDQFVEISGLADGVYALEITIDPDDNVVESNERDNTECVLIELEGANARIVGRPRNC